MAIFNYSVTREAEIKYLPQYGDGEYILYVLIDYYGQIEGEVEQATYYALNGDPSGYTEDSYIVDLESTKPDDDYEISLSYDNPDALRRLFDAMSEVGGWEIVNLASIKSYHLELSENEPDWDLIAKEDRMNNIAYFEHQAEQDEKKLWSA